MLILHEYPNIIAKHYLKYEKYLRISKIPIGFCVNIPKDDSNAEGVAVAFRDCGGNVIWDFRL